MKTCYVLFAILVLLNIFDIYSTNILLEAGYEEFNPIMAFFMDKFGPMQGLLLFKVPILLAILTGLFLYSARPWYDKRYLLASMSIVTLVYLGTTYGANFRMMMAM